MEKTLVILFANDTMISVYPSKIKALLPIGNIPCLSVCIKSFIEALKTNITFFIIANECHHQELHTEIHRWHPMDEMEGVSFEFKLTETFDNRNASTLKSIIDQLCGEKHSFKNVFISDCSFPLLGNEVIQKMNEKKNDCFAMVGNFKDPKFTLSRRLLDGISISEENYIDFPHVPENNRIFPYYFMNTVILPYEEFFAKFSNITENKNYYRLFPWKPFLLPTYLMKFEGVPFMLCNDRVYLDNLYWKKKNTQHLQYINNIWLKWIDASNRLDTIEKKIEKIKSISRSKK